jgi:hypothetical protein
MKRSYSITLLASLLALASCESSECGLPTGWVLATSLKPSPVPYTPLPVVYAEETSPGTWRWMDRSGSGNELLTSLEGVGVLNPRPALLFKFANGQSCSDLTAKCKAIVLAAKCSEDYGPCIEGTPDEYRSARKEP